MPSPIEMALSSLLPTVSYLPPELISLATSLLAQSKSKASSLKPEEEIGRTYACCHIACQRLGHKFALEIAKPAPPVKPKVYSKLHTYLNAVLKTTAAPRTPTTRRTEDRIQQDTPSRPTRSPATTQPTQLKDKPSSSNPRKRTAAVIAQDNPGIPEWTKPVIRAVCNSCNLPTAIPHVFAGLSSITDFLDYPKLPAKKRPKLDYHPAGRGELVPPCQLHDDQITNLIVGILIVVVSIMNGWRYVDDPVVADNAYRALWPLEGEQKEWVYAENLALLEEVYWFRDCIKEVWWGMEWVKNVPSHPSNEPGEPKTRLDWVEDGDDGVDEDGVDVGEAEDEVVRTPQRPAKTPLRRKEKHASGEEDEVGAAGLLPGLGTMFQPAVDWLSEERQEDFVRWKRDVLRQAAAVS